LNRSNLKSGCSEAFARSGFDYVNQTSKVTLFERRAKDVYFVNENKRIKIVVHPGMSAAAETASRTAGCILEDFYHNSNMTRFPKKANGGRSQISYGLGISCPTVGNLEAFLRAYSEIE